MLHESEERILRTISDDALILDVGGWANPFNRANYVLDQGAYETRSIGYHGVGKLSITVDYPTPLPGERFTRETWTNHDACSDQPFPFPDKFFDFCVCSHTLEDLQKPGRVCSEILRVAKAGYIETPSRLSEQTLGLTSEVPVGFPHHFWLVDAHHGALRFLRKPETWKKSCTVPAAFTFARPEADRVVPFWWQDSFSWNVVEEYDVMAECRGFVRQLKVPLYFRLKSALKRTRARLYPPAKPSLLPTGEQHLWTWPALFEANPRYLSNRERRRERKPSES